MKNRRYFRSFGILTVLLFITVVSTAQESLRTGYFLNGNLYRHKINPAMMNDQNYISLPVLGGVSVNAAGDVGIDNFVFRNNAGEKVTFMHSSVDANEFLSGIGSENKIMADIDMTIMSAGFSAFGGYNTIDIGFHSRTGASVPYEMFDFMKNLDYNSSYSINDVNILTRNYVDIAFGHSRKITKDLTLGARVKFILGLAYADVNLDRVDVISNPSALKWTVRTQGSANVSFGGDFKYSDNRMINGTKAVNGYDDPSLGVNGFGMGIDFGAVYDLSNVLTKGLIVSASVTDLGFMNWKKVSKAVIDQNNPFEFDGFEYVKEHDVSPDDIDEQFNSLKDDLEEFLFFEDKGKGSESSSLAATLNLGVEYKMPFYDKLSAGVLFTNRFDGDYSFYKVSLMANIAPVKWFEFAVSGTKSTFGTGFGAMANVRFTGFNLFVGTDCFFSDLGEYSIPAKDMNASVSVGVNVPFGKRGGKSKKVEIAE